MFKLATRKFTTKFTARASRFLFFTAAAKTFGFSDGAYTGYKLASMYPERVERIVAIGAGTLRPGYYATDSLKVSDIEQADKKFVDYLKSIIPEPERLQEFWTDYMTFWSKADIGAEFFSTIKCPVLLIAGDEDDHAPLATMLETHRAIPSSRLCIVPKAGHTAFLGAGFKICRAAMEDFIFADVKDLKPSAKVDYNSKFKLAD